MNRAQMLEQMVAHYAGGNKARFASILGVRPQTINTWITRDTFDPELIYAKCEGVSGDWLLSGEGSMLKADRFDMSGSEIVSICRALLRMEGERTELTERLTKLLK